MTLTLIITIEIVSVIPDGHCHYVDITTAEAVNYSLTGYVNVFLPYHSRNILSIGGK